ncbi:hypothetical protein [Kaistia terrae]|uniref:Uncharacterized protein n=1 Tax=Kaistia terrae TaxID=537017 RepID=A0ABW0PZ12_9HYPH|nr:hypothetical protein [Kaistia terrae]MCX5581631.1 hypothetical protein [Kaistia terrae]
MIKQISVALTFSLLAFDLAGAAPGCPTLDLRKETTATSSLLSKAGLSATQRAASMAYLKKKTEAWNEIPLNPAGAACGVQPIAARVASCTRGMARDLFAQSSKPLGAVEPVRGELRRQLGRAKTTVGELLFAGAVGACQGAAIDAFGR